MSAKYISVEVKIRFAIYTTYISFFFSSFFCSITSRLPLTQNAWMALLRNEKRTNDRRVFCVWKVWFFGRGQIITWKIYFSRDIWSRFRIFFLLLLPLFFRLFCCCCCLCLLDEESGWWQRIYSIHVVREARTRKYINIILYDWCIWMVFMFVVDIYHVCVLRSCGTTGKFFHDYYQYYYIITWTSFGRSE